MWISGFIFAKIRKCESQKLWYNSLQRNAGLLRIYLRGGEKGGPGEQMDSGDLPARLPTGGGQAGPGLL